MEEQNAQNDSISLLSRFFRILFFREKKKKSRESVNFELRTKRGLSITTSHIAPKLKTYKATTSIFRASILQLLVMLIKLLHTHTYIHIGRERDREREPWKNSAAVRFGWTWEEESSSEAVEEGRRWHWIAWRRRWACDSNIFSGKCSRKKEFSQRKRKKREKRKLLVGKLVYLVCVSFALRYKNLSEFNK